MPEDNEEKETVTLLKSEYDYLMERDEKLTALEGGGVDNWNGYDFAMEALREDEDED